MNKKKQYNAPTTQLLPQQFQLLLDLPTGSGYTNDGDESGGGLSKETDWEEAEPTGWE